MKSPTILASILALVSMAPSAAPAPQQKCPSQQSFDLPAGPLTCGACDCTPDQGVPNANLAAAISKYISDHFCGCEGCYSWQTGCAPTTTWTLAGAVTTDEPCVPEAPENLECEVGTRRCVTIFGGTGTLACGPCSN